MIMVLGTVTCMDLSVFAAQIDAGVINSGEIKQVNIENAGDVYAFSFTPAQSGTYFFKSSSPSGYLDTFGSISAPDDMLGSNDDGAGNGHFLVSCYLSQGVTYTLSARLLSEDNTGSFNVTVYPDLLTGVTAVWSAGKIYDKTNFGYYDTDEYYDDAANDWVETDEYFKYSFDSYYFSYTVVYNGETHSNLTKNEVRSLTGYTPSVSAPGQSFNSQWGIGKHNVNITVGSVSCTAEIEILPDPITGFSATFAEHLYDGIEGGYLCNKYDDDWNVIDTWYKYNIYASSFTYDMVYNGVSYTGLSYDEVYELTGIYPSVSGDDQSYENQWGVGTHNLTVKFFSSSITVGVEVEENPYVSLEILETQPVNAYSGSLWVCFKYQVTDKDGNNFIGFRNYYGMDSYYYSEDNRFNLEVEKLGTWAPGPGNQFRATIGKKLSAIGEVECYDSPDWEYTVIDGGAYISEGDFSETECTVPVTIDGFPVVGISGLNMGDSWVVPDTLTITVPDSDNEISLSQRWLGSGNPEGYQVINLGKSVKNIDNDMFTGCKRLKAINVSADNPYYTSVNGVVYTKDMKTLVAFPRGFEGTYNVPAEVENIDVLTLSIYSDIEKVFPNTSSCNFVKENGVTYNKDKTVILFSDKNISGNYVMPSSVKEIREKAFDGCTNLTGITISSNVTEIVYAVFADCSSLKNVTIPDSVKKIGNTAFGGCSALTAVNIPSGVETIDTNAFMRCSGLENVTFNNGLISIGNHAFEECTSLASVTIPDSVKTICGYAFINDTALSSLKVGRGIENIDYCAFSGCTSLSSITLPDKLFSLNAEAFGGTAACNSRQNGLFYVGTYLVQAFRDEIGESVTVKSGIKYITPGAFNTIVYSAKSLSLPASLEYFSNTRRWDNNNLETITVDSTAYLSKDNIVYEKQSGKAVYAARESKGTSITAPDSVTEFVYECRATGTVSSIKLPNKLVSLNKNFNETKWYENQPEGAVYLGKSLYFYKGRPSDYFSVSIKNGTLGIGAYAFENQLCLASVTFPNTLEEIGKSAFRNCFSLTELSFPASLKTIGDDAFGSCKNLHTVTLANGLETIGNFAFAGCSNLKQLTIPASVKEIGIGVFSNCPSLEVISVDPSSEYFKVVDGALYSKDGSRFIWCPSSKTGCITLDSSVISVDPYAFGSTSLTDIYIYNASLDISAKAFSTIWYYASYAEYRTSSSGDIKTVILHSLADSTAEKYANSSSKIMFAELENVDTEKLEKLSELSGRILELKNIDTSNLTEASKAAVAQAVAQAQAALNNKDITVEEINREIERVTEVMNSLEEVLPDKEFPDVPKGAWFYEAATYCANKGFINGYGNGNFGATDPLQRQDFVVILANIAKADLSGYTTCKLKDVDMNAYYGKAVAWAVDKGIIAGYQNGKFGVGDPINREQVATILYRYMKNPAVSDVDGKLAKFPDKGNISEFAKAPLAWAVENNIISGMQDGTVAPKGTAVRAQIASIIMRMDQNGMFNA